MCPIDVLDETETCCFVALIVAMTCAEEGDAVTGTKEGVDVTGAEEGDAVTGVTVGDAVMVTWSESTGG